MGSTWVYIILAQKQTLRACYTHLDEAVLTNTHNLCLEQKSGNIINHHLTLILLNKLNLPHPFLTVNQSDNSMLFDHIPDVS